LTQQDDLLNPSIVKVVTDTRGEALYFSRSPIPFLRDGKGSMVEQAPYYSHLGIYVYRRDILLRFAELPAGVLEETEQLEQLRALEHGYSIQVWETQHPSLRIDRPEDLEEASHILTEGARQ
jgi:3-deoxy-manno-octulosonate cytidylyltransferase (CMP-KDO synthetase)